MINLLPPDEKQNLLKEEQWKVILILGTIILVFLVSFGLILIAINVSISAQVGIQKLTLSQTEKKFEDAEIQSLKTEITQANQSIMRLQSFYKQQESFIGFLGEISDLLPEGVYLNNISITPAAKTDGKFQVSLSGHAPLIENVIALDDNLKKDQKISQVSFPSDTWVKKENVDFNVTFQAVIQR